MHAGKHAYYDQCNYNEIAIPNLMIIQPRIEHVGYHENLRKCILKLLLVKLQYNIEIFMHAFTVRIYI